MYGGKSPRARSLTTIAISSGVRVQAGLNQPACLVALGLGKRVRCARDAATAHRVLPPVLPPRFSCRAGSERILAA